MPVRRDPNPWLDREEQAERLGVGVNTITQYVRRYGPAHPNPYPTHSDDPTIAKRFGRSTAVRAAALTAWNDKRGGSHGRPRIHPAGLTAPQHRALAAIDAGQRPSPRTTLALITTGHATAGPEGIRLTKAGRDVLTAYPATRSGQDQA
jgi:transposase